MLAVPAARLLTATVAVVAPSTTVTVAGTEATEELLVLKFTTRPPAGAALGSVTVRFCEEFISIEAVVGVSVITPAEVTVTACVALV